MYDSAKVSRIEHSDFRFLMGDHKIKYVVAYVEALWEGEAY